MINLLKKLKIFRKNKIKAKALPIFMWHEGLKVYLGFDMKKKDIYTIDKSSHGNYPDFNTLACLPPHNRQTLIEWIHKQNNIKGLGFNMTFDGVELNLLNGIFFYDEVPIDRQKASKSNLLLGKFK